MIKISKNRLLLVALLLVVLLSLVSCGNNDATTYENGIDITVSKGLKSSFINPEQLPVLHFDYNNVKAVEESDGAAYFFVKNDQYELSDKFAAHLSQYSTDQIIVISSSLQTYDKGSAKFGSDKLKLDDVLENGEKQEYSTEYQIVAVTSNGTRYSYQYRTFLSGGKRYYIYRYVSNMGISLEQSLMVVKDGSDNKLLLLPLPFDTKYEVSGNALNKKSLLEKDTYLDEKYYKFAYPSYLDGKEESEKISLIKEWYQKYCNGKTDSYGRYVINYLESNFLVEFEIKDAGNTRDKEGFKLTYLP